MHAAEQRFIAPGVQRIAQLSELALSEGRGCRLTDVDGNEYLDFFAGVAVASPPPRRHVEVDRVIDHGLLELREDRRMGAPALLGLVGRRRGEDAAARAHRE